MTSTKTFEKERRELQHEVAVVAHPLVLENICKHATNKCLRLVLSVLRESLKYGYREKANCYEVYPYERRQRGSTVIFHPIEQVFVCLSCTFFNIYGLPCPCIMAVYRSLHSPEERWLPFVSRNLYGAAGSDIARMYQNLPLGEDSIGKKITPDDLLKDICDKQVGEGSETTTRGMQHDDDERNHLQADNKDSNNTSKPFEPRRNTEEIKLEEGMGTGQKALNARRWYTDNILIPILREANYDKHEWSALVEGVHRIKQSREHKLYYSGVNSSAASRSSKNTSFIGKVGFYQSLKPTELGLGLGSRAPRKYFPYLDTAKQTNEGIFCNFLGYKEKDLISEEEYEASAAASTECRSRRNTQSMRRKPDNDQNTKLSRTSRASQPKRRTSQLPKASKRKRAKKSSY